MGIHSLVPSTLRRGARTRNLRALADVSELLGAEAGHDRKNGTRERWKQRIMATQDLATARSHALFLCELQPSQNPDVEEIHAAVTRTVQTYGVHGCLERVAQEYGDHPETAPQRMRWARELVSKAYPGPRPRAATTQEN